MVGIILGILFGTGVLGGKSGPSEAGEYVTVEGQKYPANTVTVETTYIENDVEDGNSGTTRAGVPVGTYPIFQDRDGNNVISKDGQNYPVESLGANNLVTIDDRDYILRDGELYPVEKDGRIAYYTVDGQRHKLPEQDKLEVIEDE